jgi:hypothetical protein
MTEPTTNTALTNGEGPVPDEAQVDPYSPELHMISGPDVSVEKVLLAVKVRKPRKDEFIRVHPDPEYTRDYVLLEIEDGMDRVRYLVLPAQRPLIPLELSPTRLSVAINREGEVFLWPIRLPLNKAGGAREWSDSALKCADEAKHLWVRIQANKAAGYYDLYRAQANLGDPEWPRKSFRDLVELAFKGNVVDRRDHPVIERLTGQR